MPYDLYAYNAPAPTGVMRPACKSGGKPLLMAWHDTANPFNPKTYNRPALVETPLAFASGDRHGEGVFGNLMAAGLAGARVSTNSTDSTYYASYTGIIRVVNGGHTTVTATLGVSGFGGSGNRAAGARVSLVARVKDFLGDYFYVEVACHPGGGVHLTEASPTQVYGAGKLFVYGVYIYVSAVADDGETGGEVRVDLSYA
jgi:hypothetical protein